MDSPADVLVLGAGYVGRRVAWLARERSRSVAASVRSAERAGQVAREGIEVLVRPCLVRDEVATWIGPNTQVVVCFPPDGFTDHAIAPALRNARAISYVSSTGVYGDAAGVIDDQTPVPPPDARAQRILDAEQCYREQGATVLRCPGIYGPDRGLHMRVRRGEHRIPGDGSRSLSRIHADDLAALLLASADARGETFVIGDLAPEAHIEVVRFICATYGVPLPPFEELARVHRTLRADRRVDASRALSALGVLLRYPSYRDGMSRAATGL